LRAFSISDKGDKLGRNRSRAPSTWSQPLRTWVRFAARDPQPGARRSRQPLRSDLRFRRGLFDRPLGADRGAYRRAGPSSERV